MGLQLSQLAHVGVTACWRPFLIHFSGKGAHSIPQDPQKPLSPVPATQVKDQILTPESTLGSEL